MEMQKSFLIVCTSLLGTTRASHNPAIWKFYPCNLFVHAFTIVLIRVFWVWFQRSLQQKASMASRRSQILLGAAILALPLLQVAAQDGYAVTPAALAYEHTVEKNHKVLIAHAVFGCLAVAFFAPLGAVLIRLNIPGVNILWLHASWQMSVYAMEVDVFIPRNAHANHRAGTSSVSVWESGCECKSEAATPRGCFLMLSSATSSSASSRLSLFSALCTI